MKYLVFILTIWFCQSAFAQSSNEVIEISDDVEVIKLSDNVYIHVTYHQSEKWGRISANGLIFIDKAEAFLFDTPWSEEQTEILITWLSDSLKVIVTGFVPNHWHVDCIGGLACIKKHNIKSYANQMTIEIAEDKELPTPETGFKDSLQLQVGSKYVECYYLGAAHSLDNIVVWIPTEQLLFAGCVLKGSGYKNIGFTGDGDLKEYPKTLTKLLAKFPEAKIVIPGHGDYGGIELVHHNLKLLNQ